LNTENFLKRLWSNPPGGYFATWTKSNATRFFASSEVEEADAYMKAIANHEDVYFTVGMLRQKPARGRGAASDVVYLPCMHADFDLLGDLNVHAKTALPKSVDELCAFLSEVSIPKPTTLVNSGNGVHAYWQLKQPMDLRDTADHRKGAEMLSGFQRAIIQLAKDRRGWHFDNTGDLARVLRYPGTKNHKTNPAKNVEVL
jgi:hypothetical protein